MAFQVGDRIGDYQVIEILGAGGMGQVYKVQNIISKRVEAMKVLLPNLESDPNLAERFIQEIQVQASLDHPNIAALHTAQRVDNQLVMVMEFVEGTTVDGLLKDGPLPMDKALEYTIQVLAALSYAHGRGVIHRDIKPANMMLTPDGTIKLMDFGIAKLADRQLTRTGHTVGSLFYMSPEQINNPHALDARSDIYSLGVSMYEMVTGRRPFQGDSDYSIMLGHLSKPAEPPVAVDPRVPQELSDVILMSMAKEPEKRFQSADAFKRALESIHGSLGFGKAAAAAAAPAMQTMPMAPPVSAAPIPATPPVRPAPASKRGLYIALGSVATVVVLALAAWQGPKFFGSSAASPAPVTQAPVTQTPSTPVEPAPAVQTPPAETPTPPVSESPAPSTAATPQKPAAAQSSAQPHASKAPAGAVKTAGQPAVETPGSSSPSQPVQPPPAQTAAPPAAPPGPDAAAMREVRKQLMTLGTRARTLNDTLDQMKAQQARMGLGLRTDMVNAQKMMEMHLDDAEAAWKSGELDQARKDLQDAEREVEKLEKFIGR